MLILGETPRAPYQVVSHPKWLSDSEGIFALVRSVFTLLTQTVSISISRLPRTDSLLLVDPCMHPHSLDGNRERHLRDYSSGPRCFAFLFHPSRNVMRIFGSRPRLNDNGTCRDLFALASRYAHTTSSAIVSAKTFHSPRHRSIAL